MGILRVLLVGIVQSCIHNCLLPFSIAVVYPSQVDIVKESVKIEATEPGANGIRFSTLALLGVRIALDAIA